MSKAQNKLILHLCGGAGINIGDKVLSTVADLGEGFADLVFNYIDTSRSNIDKINPLGKFTHINAASFGKGVIDGSGSVRSANAQDIEVGVKNYLDENRYTKNVTGEFHVVISSGSGGSGSTINPYIVNTLLSKNIPVMSVIIGDSSNGLSASNTIKTLMSLDNIVRRQNKPLTMMYVNNHKFISKGAQKAEEESNKILFNMFSALSLFMASTNEALDYADILGILDPTMYNSSLPAPVKPGLYGIYIHSGGIEFEENMTPLIARSLSKEGVSFDTGLTLGHHKRGYISADNTNVLSIYEDKLPLHLVLYANFFKDEVGVLNKINQNYKDILENIHSDELFGDVNTSAIDDTGMVF